MDKNQVSGVIKTPSCQVDSFIFLMKQKGCKPLLEICINKRRSVNIVDINTGNITSFGLHVKTTH